MVPILYAILVVCTIKPRLHLDDRLTLVPRRLNTIELIPSALRLLVQTLFNFDRLLGDLPIVAVLIEAESFIDRTLDEGALGVPSLVVIISFVTFVCFLCYLVVEHELLGTLIFS
jgi:hypothetical protein